MSVKFGSMARSTAGAFVESPFHARAVGWPRRYKVYITATKNLMQAGSCAKDFQHNFVYGNICNQWLTVTRNTPAAYPDPLWADYDGDLDAEIWSPIVGCSPDVGPIRHTYRRCYMLQYHAAISRFVFLFSCIMPRNPATGGVADDDPDRSWRYLMSQVSYFRQWIAVEWSPSGAASRPSAVKSGTYPGDFLHNRNFYGGIDVTSVEVANV